MQCDLDTSVSDWLIDRPESAPVFAELQIDTSCGGKSLEYVCRQQGIIRRLSWRDLWISRTASKVKVKGR